MPRPPRIFFAGAKHHIIARGNNKMALFRERADFRVYRALWVIAKKRFHLNIYRWTWMTNHIHVLLEQRLDGGVAEAMHFIQVRYARYFARRYGWKGHVWESRYTNRLILDESYFLRCARYIEQNPVEAGLVEKADHYPWSSAAFYARGFRDPLTDRDFLNAEERGEPTVQPLHIGRRAVGSLPQLQLLSQKVGRNLLSRSRVKTAYP